MMPPNYDYSNPPKLYMSDSTNLKPFDQIPTLRVTVPDYEPYVPQSWLKLNDVSCLMYCNLPRKWKWHRIIGWQGKTAYRPRHRQRLKAFGIMRRWYMKRATD